MRVYSSSDDHVRNVVLSVMERLGAKNRRGVKNYPPWQARYPAKTFADWLRIVSKNTARDYLRTQLGVVPQARTDEGEIHGKRLLNEFAVALPEELGARPPMTTAQTARQLLEFASERLPGDQVLALKKWLDGVDFAEIAEQLNFEDSLEAQKMVRAAVASLRRAFADQQ